MAIVLSGLGVVTVAAPGTPVALSATPVACKRFTLYGYKSLNPPVANTGAVYIFTPGTNGSKAKPSYIIPSGQSIVIDRPRSDAGFYDLSTLSVDADTASDGIVVGYSQE